MASIFPTDRHLAPEQGQERQAFTQGVAGQGLNIGAPMPDRLVSLNALDALNRMPLPDHLQKLVQSLFGVVTDRLIGEAIMDTIMRTQIQMRSASASLWDRDAE